MNGLVKKSDRIYLIEVCHYHAVDIRRFLSPKARKILPKLYFRRTVVQLWFDISDYYVNGESFLKQGIEYSLF